jgi:hypothetical protein
MIVEHRFSARRHHRLLAPRTMSLDAGIKKEAMSVKTLHKGFDL